MDGLVRKKWEDQKRREREERMNKEIQGGTTKTKDYLKVVQKLKTVNTSSIHNYMKVLYNISPNNV